MKEATSLHSWEAFEDELKRLRERQRLAGRTSSQLLFRGQSDSSWRLETTLERREYRQMAFVDYYTAISNAKPQIETFTEHRWALRGRHEIEPVLGEYEAFAINQIPNVEESRFMVYLRHYGFPSPLLDWSRSPYIAAYFAFRNAVKGGKVSIYVFWEKPDGFKVGSSDDPQVQVFGSKIGSHRRHFRQQSEYTLCLIYQSRWLLASYHDLQRYNIEQDTILRYDIPSSEQRKILQLLDEHNINAFSLFESEESLMDTLGWRELESSDKR
jgi:hypothetical protein